MKDLTTASLRGGCPSHSIKRFKMEKEKSRNRVHEWWDFAVAAKSKEDRDSEKAMFKNLSDELTREERRLAGQYLREYMRERAKVRKYNAAKCEDFNPKEYIKDIESILNFSEIAKQYFGKDRAWLHQRINGSIVNGKKAAFTQEEKQIFIHALRDTCARISDSITSIH